MSSSAPQTASVLNLSGNALLTALPAADQGRLAAHLERVSLRLGEMLYEPGKPAQHAYFPITAIISLHCALSSGVSSETASVGNDGMVGVALFMGGSSMASSAVVQISGEAYRLDANIFRAEFERLGALGRIMLRYAQALIMQTGQSVVCYRHHTIEQQLCRWLLATVDRSPSLALTMTQELIANTLGVRRESITEVASRLQQAGVIRYRRGHISIEDRAGLELRACECYEVTRREARRLLALKLDGAVRS